MDITTLFSSAALSAVVSGAVAVGIKTAIKAAIERRYNLEFQNLKARHELDMEKLKANLAKKTYTERELIERRMVAYPKLVSLIYRTRNMSRDLAAHLTETNFSLVDELAERTKDLEEALYEFRFYLERDSLFDRVHNYKNMAINFSIRAGDVKFFIEHGEEPRAQNVAKELATMYNKIEEVHKGIIAKLSSLGVNKVTRDSAGLMPTSEE